MSLASAHQHLSPSALLLLLLGVAAIDTAWLAIVAIRV
jgi:hypothetical protein